MLETRFPRTPLCGNPSPTSLMCVNQAVDETGYHELSSYNGPRTVRMPIR
jgi:hypothetical protein